MVEQDKPSRKRDKLHNEHDKQPRERDKPIASKKFYGTL